MRKIAALNEERFAEATGDTRRELRNGAKNIYTRSVLKAWCEGKGLALEIEEHEAGELSR